MTKSTNSAPSVARAKERSLRGSVAIVGVGESPYYKRGKSPDSEFKLALQAILAACADAGMDPRRIDGFASFSNDRNEAWRLAAALGLPRFRFSNMQWGGGGGGCAAAVANAAAAVATGIADCVVVFRALAQGQFQRFGAAPEGNHVTGDQALIYPYGMFTPAQRFAMKTTRYLHDHGIDPAVMKAIAMASYHHAQLNPRAVMYGKSLTEQAYDEARWIVEPFGLYDCCMENDGAAALIVVPAEQAADFKQQPVYLLGAAQGAEYRNAARSYNAPLYPSSSFTSVARDLFAGAGVGPHEIDVVQVYENFTGAVLMSLVEHGFFRPEEANQFLVLENLVAPSGRLPMNTSGGNLAECYVHGMELIVEAARQIRGQSTAQVPDAKLSMVIGGPMTNPVSNLIFGARETL